MPTITLSDIAAEAWDKAPFVREFDLTLAANVLASLQSGATLYNRVIEDHLAARCIRLDHGAAGEGTRRVPGVISVQPDHDQPWKEVERATAFLADKPRGTWGVFRRHEGGYEAFVSCGNGEIDSERGHLFQKKRADHPDFTDMAMYARVLGCPAYYRRNEIEAEIYAATVTAAVASGKLEEGADVRDRFCAGKRWGSIVYTGPSKMGSGHGLRLTSRGRRAHIGQTDNAGLVRLFGLPLVMPEAYRDPHNHTRLCDGMRAALLKNAA